MRISLSVIWVIFVLLFTSSYAEACSCQEYRTVSHAIAATDYIFIGESVGTETVTHVISNLNNFQAKTSKTKFKLSSSYKGNLPDNVVVSHFDGSSSSCGISFEENQLHIVFAYKLEDGTYGTNLCSKGYWYTDQQYLLYMMLGINSDHPDLIIHKSDIFEELANDPWGTQDRYKQCKQTNLKLFSQALKIDIALANKIDAKLAGLPADKKFDFVVNIDADNNSFIKDTQQDSALLYILNQLAHEGSAEAMNEVGAILLYCDYDVAQDIPQGLAYLKQAASMGDLFAMANLGRHYWSNDTRPINSVLGLWYVSKCANLGDENCKSMLDKRSFMKEHEDEISKYKQTP